MKTPRHLSYKTKILCTMGPAIGSEDKIAEALFAGASAFRLNMSHSTHKTHTQYVQYIRKAEKKTNMFVPIIADLQGPKLRVGELGDGVMLMTGQTIIIADPNVLKRKRVKAPEGGYIPLEYPSLARDVKKGDTLLFDDGLLSAQVVASDGVFVKAVVINGGLLKSRKGLNLPHIKVSVPSITRKDKEDILFAIKNDVDYIAVSFVRSANDVKSVRKLLEQHNSDIRIIAKVEKPEALVNIEEIIQASDVIMVARGDLGVEIPAANVPMEQKRIISLCNNYAKPVITATQMLESMIKNPRPTRAEASDIANAVLDGTDAVMLSAETSVGAYPIEAISYMRMICTEAEKSMFNDNKLFTRKLGIKVTKEQNTDSIAAAASTIAEEQNINCIATLSYSGETAHLISNRRPRAPILAVTSMLRTVRRVGLYWGVTGFHVEKITTTDDTIEHIKKLLVARSYFEKGATVVFTIGRPLVARSRTNMLSIETL
ncbi:MAG: pyruvate kinase [Bacteriodetes bacterium]|nr:pyruvate kinase [Bacteroidota bacterium]